MQGELLNAFSVRPNHKLVAAGQLHNCPGPALPIALFPPCISPRPVRLIKILTSPPLPTTLAHFKADQADLIGLDLRFLHEYQSSKFEWA